MSTTFASFPDDTPVPDPEPDAIRRLVTVHPIPGEYGIDAVARDIGEHLMLLLAWPVTDLTVLENPWDRHPCPQATFYEMSCAGHHIRITNYEAHYPGRRDLYTAHAITLDGRTIPFRRLVADPIASQLAEAIWLAHLDLPEHTHPIHPDDEDRSQQ